MISDPEWASKEEWNTYAWFGFAIQEAQALERLLLVIAVALKMRKGSLHSHEERWPFLYDKLGCLTLGQILNCVKKYTQLPETLERDLRVAVNTRNDLAHTFFWPKNISGVEQVEEAAQAKLKAAASLFSNLTPQLEAIIWPLLDDLEVERSLVEAQVTKLLTDQENGKCAG